MAAAKVEALQFTLTCDLEENAAGPPRGVVTVTAEGVSLRLEADVTVLESNEAAGRFLQHVGKMLAEGAPPAPPQGTLN